MEFIYFTEKIIVVLKILSLRRLSSKIYTNLSVLIRKNFYKSEKNLYFDVNNGEINLCQKCTYFTKTRHFHAEQIWYKSNNIWGISCG